MERTDRVYAAYVRILKRELVPAMGCTEPISLALCAARARDVLGRMPERAEVLASGNIIKNVKSVVIPHAGGAKGLEAAVAAGFVAGKWERGLEALSEAPAGTAEEVEELLSRMKVKITPVESGHVLDITVRAFAGTDGASVRIADRHTGFVRVERNGEVLFEEEVGECDAPCEDDALLNMKDIVGFAREADLADVREVLSRQIEYNTAVSEEGLRRPYGANIGKVLLSAYGDDIRTRAKASAAAGSDARMNGCELPVVINSGSGNQGMTTSLPVIEYARERGAGEDMLYRALIVSNLTAIHLKSGIGALSAYCGAVSAGAAAGAGIAFLCGGDLACISHTVTNALAITSGIVCDGAKASCAAKISAAVDAGIFGYEMYRRGQNFYGGDGIVSDAVERTIGNVGRLGREGMRETDREILTIMTCFD